MPSVSTPDALDVARRCGLDRYAEGFDDNSQFYASIAEFIADAEAETAMAVTEAVYTSSSLSAYQVRALAVAVSCRAAAGWLLSPAIRKLTGTHEPLLVEDSEEFAAVIDGLYARARRLETQVTAGTENPPFALPVVAASTFTYGEGDRLPYGRLLLTDESDGISAWDTEQG